MIIKPQLVTRVIFCLLVAIIVMDCNGETSSKSRSNSVVTLTISTFKTTYKVGESIPVGVAIENCSQDEIYIETNPHRYIRVGTVQILDSHGKKLSSWTTERQPGAIPERDININGKSVHIVPVEPIKSMASIVETIPDILELYGSVGEGTYTIKRELRCSVYDPKSVITPKLASLDYETYICLPPEGRKSVPVIESNTITIKIEKETSPITPSKASETFAISTFKTNYMLGESIPLTFGFLNKSSEDTYLLSDRCITATITDSNGNQVAEKPNSGLYSIEYITTMTNGKESPIYVVRRLRPMHWSINIFTDLLKYYPIDKKGSYTIQVKRLVSVYDKKSVFTMPDEEAYRYWINLGTATPAVKQMVKSNTIEIEIQ